MGLLQLPTDPPPAALAKFEFRTRVLGTTFMKEFQPRWALRIPQRNIGKWNEEPASSET